LQENEAAVRALEYMRGEGGEEKTVEGDGVLTGEIAGQNKQTEITSENQGD
jgi:hypothetical protein